jgi:hypothetical protein
MNIDEKTLLSEKELLTKDFNSISEKIKQVEIELGSMRSNLNAIYGALQQTDKLLKMSETKITYSDEIKDSNEKI